MIGAFGGLIGYRVDGSKQGLVYLTRIFFLSEPVIRHKHLCLMRKSTVLPSALF